jgi:hypothetical protein
MHGYTLFFGDHAVASSRSLDWIKREATPFHAKRHGGKRPFVLPDDGDPIAVNACEED